MSWRLYHHRLPVLAPTGVLHAGASAGNSADNTVNSTASRSIIPLLSNFAVASRGLSALLRRCGLVGRASRSIKLRGS